MLHSPSSDPTPTALDRVNQALTDCATRIRRLEAKLAPVAQRRTALEAEAAFIENEQGEGVLGKLAVVHGHVGRLDREAVELHKRALADGRTEAHNRTMLRAKANLNGKIAGEAALAEASAEGKALQRRCKYLEFTLAKVHNERREQRDARPALAGRQDGEWGSRITISFCVGADEDAAGSAGAAGRETPATTASPPTRARGSFELERVSRAVEVLSEGVEATNRRVDALRASNGEWNQLVPGSFD